VIHNGMLYDPIQGQGHGGPKCEKMSDFKCCLLRQYACNQKTNSELWYSKTMSNFNRTHCWYLSSFGITWPSNL